MLELALCLAISKELITYKVIEASRDFGVSEQMMLYVVNRESAKDKDGNFLPCGIGDTHLIDPTGKPHRSRGIVQINDYYHPQITDAMAFNPSFSIEFLATKIREGKCYLWTTCRNYLKLPISER